MHPKKLIIFHAIGVFVCQRIDAPQIMLEPEYCTIEKCSIDA